MGLQALSLRSCFFSWDSLHDNGDSRPDVLELHLYLGMCLGALLTAFSTVKRNNPPFEMLGHGPRSMPCRVEK